MIAIQKSVKGGREGSRDLLLEFWDPIFLLVSFKRLDQM